MREAAAAATRRVLGDLRDLFDAAPAGQRVTTLQLVRTAVAEPTAVLAGAGVPPVARDAFEERALPDDRYDLAPRALRDLGDEALGPAQLAWGTAKAAVLRAGGPSTSRGGREGRHRRPLGCGP